MIITLSDLECRLLPEKALLLPELRLLVIADVHLGKLVHFRRQGIMAPNRIINEDIERIRQLIRQWQPQEVVFLGDLFHSDINSEYEDLAALIATSPGVQFTLTRGNHDIIPEKYFQEIGLGVCTEIVLTGRIILRHELPVIPDNACCYITGHIHPGYLAAGRARQHYRLPCYYQNAQGLVLPAFGQHTGLYMPDYKKGDRVFIIMDQEIVPYEIK